MPTRNLLIVLLAATAPGNATAGVVVIAGPITNPANGNSYYLLPRNSWTGSQAEAIALGGNLATINDAAENAWIIGTFAEFGGVSRALWIGLNDAAVEGRFVWASGEPVGYTNWGPAEPNNWKGVEDWAHIFPSPDNRFPAWNDAPNSANAFGFSMHGVVEVMAIPEPGGLALAGVAIAGFGAWRHRRRRP
jgi:hypothetical protein